MNISRKIILATVLLSGIGIFSAGSLVGWKSSSVAAIALEKIVFEQLVTIREVQINQIERYFSTIAKGITTLSNNHMVMDMMEELPLPFSQYGQQTRLQEGGQLKGYYTQKFDEEYRSQNPSSSSSSTSKLTQLSDNTRLIQHAYISGNSNPLGSKNQLVSAEDGTRYSELHKKYHPYLNQYLESFGFYDIFLVEPETGFVVYSVFKELDFATSLYSGPRN